MLTVATIKKHADTTRMKSPGLVRRFLFVMKFAETEERIPEHVRNHVPLILKTLTDLSAMGSRPQVAFTAKDGSVVGIAFKSEERPAQIMREIRAHDKGDPSRTRLRDQILILELGNTFRIENAERLEGWLNIR